MAIKIAHGRHRHVLRPERGYNCPPRAPGGGATAVSRRFKRQFFDGQASGTMGMVLRRRHNVAYISEMCVLLGAHRLN